MLEIMQDDKFFSRLLSKENNSQSGEASFRVMYYGGATGAVPFMWESQPGTPKHHHSAAPLLPLTPPPSYYHGNHLITNKRTPMHKGPKLFKKNKICVPSSPSFSSYSLSLSSSGSSSYSLPSTPMNFSQKKYISRANSNSAVHFAFDDSEDDTEKNARNTPVLCFGGKSNRFRGCYSIRNVKKLVLSIVGHGKA